MVELKLKVNEKGQILIPKVLREKYNIEEGKFILAELREEGILLKSRPTPEEILKRLQEHVSKLKKMGIKGPKIGELKKIYLEMEFEEEKP